MNKKNVRKRVVRKNEGFFARNYRESWNYLKESKMFIFYIIGLFLLFALIGYFVSPPLILEEAFENLILELIEKTQGMNQQEIIVFIFLNNLKSAFLGMIFGVLLGIFTVFTTIFNGYLIGFVSQKVVEVESPLILLKLLPHGIFELPAIFISLGLGLRLGMFIFNKHKLKSLRYYLYNSLKVFFFIIVPLLLIAAIIEGSLIAIFG